jgi:hypothetical protein
MKDKDIADIYLDRANKLLDCLEGKKKVDDVVTFRGSHAVDTDSLRKRIVNIVVKKDIQDIEETKIIKKKNVKVK